MEKLRLRECIRTYEEQFGTHTDEAGNADQSASCLKKKKKNFRRTWLQMVNDVSINYYYYYFFF